NFTFSPNSPKTSDTISFTCTSTDEDGSIESWNWNFGDGNTSTEENPTHSYAIRGDYDILLNVTDNHGATSQKTKSITVSNTPPTANFSFSPSTPKTFQTITFTSSSIDPDGSIVNSTWDFGDNTVNYSMNTTTHQYTNNGTYTVTLNVTDNNSATDEYSINITISNVGPTADFTVEPAHPEIGETIWFNDTSTDQDGSIINWTWDFGDDTLNYSQNTTHFFSNLQSYDVSLTVTDNDNNKTTVTKHLILKETTTKQINTTEPTSFNFLDEANTKVNIKTSNTTNLSVRTFSECPAHIDESIPDYENLKTYVDVSLEDEVLLDWINLSLYYTGEDLTDDINLTSLTLFYWNETSESWGKISNSIPSISDVSSYHGFVQANISHLTLFTIAGTIAEEEETIDPTLPNIVNSSNDTIFTTTNPTLNITYDEIVPEVTASLNNTPMPVATTDNKTFSIFIPNSLSNGNYTIQLGLTNGSLSRTDLIYFSINIPPPVQKQETSIEIPVWVWYSTLIVFGGALFYFSGMLNHITKYLRKQKQHSTNEGINTEYPKKSQGILKDTLSSVQQSMSSFDALVFGSTDPWKQAQESVNHTLYNIDLFTEKPDVYVGIQEKLLTEELTCKDIINLLEHHDESIEDIKEKTNLSKENISKQITVLLKYGLIREQNSDEFQITSQAKKILKKEKERK
ncbi:MAG: PKD domain-containing protein, partial [Candidatus Thermoplasmatota archaeon]|nr:PKD domain-containing protein [Candidatus Thermoplasmatota archaeon]